MTIGTARYSRVMITLHWTTVVLVVTAYFLSENKHAVLAHPPLLHFAFGLGVLLLVLPRLIGRVLGGAPPLEDRGLLGHAAKAGHLVLYVMLVAVPISGWYTASRMGVRISVFGITVPPLTRTVSGGAGWIGIVHQYGGNLLLILAGLHATMALWHHFLRRDNTLRRMRPW